MQWGARHGFKLNRGQLVPTFHDRRFGPNVFAALLIILPAPLHAQTAQVPDLSGNWGRNLLFFEPAPSGAIPVASKNTRANGTMNIDSMAGDDANPILRPPTREVLRMRGEAGRNEAAPDPHNQCAPEPTPFTLSTQFGFEIVQAKSEVLLLSLADHKVRRVRMNALHPARVTPTWQGDSVGHYEGDTLVVDTVGQKVGPLSMVDLYGTPFSDRLHVIERYRLIDGIAARDAQKKHEASYFPPGVSSPFTNEYGRGDIDPDPTKAGLQVEVTVEDPMTFTTPWSGLITYRRVLGDWPESVCAENTREYYANRDTPIPHADKPDF
jgi:hypothetical protein